MSQSLKPVSKLLRLILLRRHILKRNMSKRIAFEMRLQDRCLTKILTLLNA